MTVREYFKGLNCYAESSAVLGQEQSLKISRNASAAIRKLHNHEIAMSADKLGRILSFITVTSAGLIAMAGLACFAAGAYGLFSGLHGGPIVAGTLAMFGSALMFVGYLCGRNGFQSQKDQQGNRKP